MYHIMGSLFPERGVRPAFCQIYTIDLATQQWEERLYLNQESFDNNLRPDVLRMLQQLLADLNPYALAFKDCDFGGKVVCFCGDFRQITPVVVGGSDADVITHSMCRAEFFHEIQVLDLTINERLNNPYLTDVARRETAEFATELIRIGDGDTTVHSAALQKDAASWPHGRMAMNTQEALMDKIYPDLPTT